MVKPCGPICNLDCRYCYYLRKRELYPNQTFRMPDEVLESFTRQYILSNHLSDITFSWQGGEPTLMGLDFFQKALKFQQKYQPAHAAISNTIQTNGTLLDDAWCAFFKDHNFLVGVSLDGPAEIHDKYRRDKLGNPTHAKVMAGIDLLNKHGVEYNILTCVHRGNTGQPQQVYDFLINQAGAKYLQFIPIVERKNLTGYQEGYTLTKRSVSGKSYGEFLISIFDTWVRRDVGTIFVQIFDAALGAWHGQPPSLCIFGKTCGNALVMEHNGDLYSCDHFVEPSHFLGNILNEALPNLVQSEKQMRFGQNKFTQLPEYCRQCEFLFACYGGCPKNRIRRTPDGEAGLNILCEGYKAFFSHVDKPMRIMSALLGQNIPPAEIMKTF